jgi:hypothetical protein
MFQRYENLFLNNAVNYAKNPSFGASP